jgi:hypothetical protein
MDSSEMKAAREARRKDGRGAQQRLRNFQKKSKATFQQNETNETSPSEVNEMTAITDESIEIVLKTPKTSVVVVSGGSPFVLLDGEPLEIPGPISPNRYTVSLTQLDVHEMLQNGALLDDQVIHGYMNLLGKTFGGSLGLRVVSTHFYAKLAQCRNWDLVNRWEREIGNTDINWETTPIIAIPIFLGPNSHGHWSNLLVDRLASESLPGGLRFYAYSLESARFSSEEVRQALEETPLSTASNAATWAVASSPIQSHGGNDCGAWQCIKFAAYMKAALNDCLYEESIDGSSSVTFELRDNMSVREWAVLARRHLLKSLCSGSIDLDDCIVTSIRVTVRVPNCRSARSVSI